MVELNEKIKHYSKELGYFRLYLKKEMKQRHITKHMIIMDPTLIPNPVISEGLFKKETLEIKVVNEELK